jgi:acyl carrier protein
VRAAAAGARLKEGGAYLLIGGLESRSGFLAGEIARVPGARIALAGRFVDGALVHALEAAGAEVLAVTDDPTSAAGVEDALRRAEARFGRLDGIVYSPEQGHAAEPASIAEARPAEWAAEVAAIEDELRALAAALGERAPDFCLIESSLAGVLGSVGRVRQAAANALADAFAAVHAREGGTRWTSVAWDRWAPEEDVATGDGTGIALTEVGAALAAVLALAGEPQLLVSPVEIEERMRAADAKKQETPAAAGTLYERPELDTEYHAPGDELEEKLAALWQELLGIERIGIHDDFFGLGGHSLLATQIVARVRDMFQLELPLQAIFEAPTIARFARLVEDAIIAELETLSDEEAEALMAQ